MKSFHLSAWFVTFIFSSIFVSNAQGATPIENVLRSFTACNGEFFYSLKDNLSPFSKIAPTIANEKNAFIAVEDRKASGKQFVKFSELAEGYGIHLSGYFDEVSVITPNEQYYNWGFYIAESPSEVRSRLNKNIKDSERLKADGPNFARLEMHDGKSWINIESPQQFSGKVPEGNIERVLLIEKSDDADLPGTRLTCSLQGPVSDIVLADVRPDLPTKDYPIRPQFSGQSFDSIPLNTEVQKVASGLLKNELFKRPKFEWATFNYKHTKKAKSKPDENWWHVETLHVTEEGSIIRKETNSSNFFVERLMLWNFVQLKLKNSNADVDLVRELKVKLPESLESGQLLETEIVSGDDHKERTSRNVCILGDRIAANEVHKLLSGYAVKVSCTDSVDGSRSQYVYIEGLGIFIPRSSIDKDQVEYVLELVNIYSNKLAESRLPALAILKNASLPKMIDSDTRLDKTIGTVDTFQFNYTLVNFTKSSGQGVIDELKKDFVKRVCSNKRTQGEFLSKGVTVTFSYYGNDGEKIEDISVSPSQCIF